MNNKFRIIEDQLTDETSVSVAKEGDTEDIQKLLFKTALWLKSKGSQQWSALLEGKDVHNTAQAIRNNHVFVFKNNGQLAGMVILLDSPSNWDKELWTDGENKDVGIDEYLYLHRLAIDRELSGGNLGLLIMNWVKEGIVFENKKGIRLDCMANVPALNEFYKNRDFQYRGNSGEFNKYEYSFNVK